MITGQGRSGTTLLQIQLRQLKAILRPHHRIQPGFGLLAHLPASHQDAVTLRRASAHAAAQLMHLRKPKPFRMFNHHHRSIRHIDAHFNHRR